MRPIMASLRDPLNPIDFNTGPHRAPTSPSATATFLLCPSKENVSPQLDVLSKINDLPISPQAPLVVKQALDFAVSYFTGTGNVGPPVWSQADSHLRPATPLNTILLPIIPSDTIIHHNIQINRQTTLETVYYYTLNTLLEYPETSADGSVGHVFTLDPQEWINPVLNFAYSLGGSHGMSQKYKTIKVGALVDASGDQVPCREMHTTCKSIILFRFRSLMFPYLRPGLQSLSIYPDIPSALQSHSRGPSPQLVAHQESPP